MFGEMDRVIQEAKKNRGHLQYRDHVVAISLMGSEMMAELNPNSF